MSRAIKPSRGIVSGSGPAVSELKGLLIRILDKHLVCHPSIELSVHVDDIGQITSDRTANGAINQLKTSASDLAQSLQGEANLTIATDKTCVVANNHRVAVRLQAALGSLGGAAAKAVRNLGVDFILRGAKRRKLVRAERW